MMNKKALFSTIVLTIFVLVASFTSLASAGQNDTVPFNPSNGCPTGFMQVGNDLKTGAPICVPRPPNWLEDLSDKYWSAECEIADNVIDWCKSWFQ